MRSEVEPHHSDLKIHTGRRPRPLRAEAAEFHAFESFTKYDHLYGRIPSAGEHQEVRDPYPPNTFNQVRQKISQFPDGGALYGELFYNPMSYGPRIVAPRFVERLQLNQTHERHDSGFSGSPDASNARFEDFNPSDGAFGRLNPVGSGFRNLETSQDDGAGLTNQYPLMLRFDRGSDFRGFEISEDDDYDMPGNGLANQYPPMPRFDGGNLSNPIYEGISLHTQNSCGSPNGIVPQAIGSFAMGQSMFENPLRDEFSAPQPHNGQIQRSASRFENMLPGAPPHDNQYQQHRASPAAYQTSQALVPRQDLSDSMHKMRSGGPADGNQHRRHCSPLAAPLAQRPKQDLADPMQAMTLAETSSSMTLFNPGPPSFRPSRAVMNEPHKLSSELTRFACKHSFDLNKNYKGGFNLENVMLPESQNCCLFIRNAPGHARLSDFLAPIYEGKVFNSKLYPPILGQFLTSAAKVAFTNRAAAQSLLNRAKYSADGVRVLGRRVIVMWNRDKSRPATDSEYHQSRVVEITGPEDFSSLEFIQLFSRYIQFELTDYKEWKVVGGKKVLQLHFASILGQSRAAMKCFIEWKKLYDPMDGFSIAYGHDPSDMANSRP